MLAAYSSTVCGDSNRAIKLYGSGGNPLIVLGGEVNANGRTII